MMRLPFCRHSDTKDSIDEELTLEGSTISPPFNCADKTESRFITERASAGESSMHASASGSRIALGELSGGRRRQSDHGEAALCSGT